MLVMTGIITYACCLINVVGMGCRLHVAHADFLMISRISSWSAGRNAESRGNVNGSMWYTSAWYVGKLFQMLSIFSLKKSLEGICALESPDGRAPMSVLCKSLSTILKSVFLITRTLSHFVAVICSTGLSDQGRGLLPLLLEHVLMNCQLGSSPLSFKFSSQTLCFRYWRCVPQGYWFDHQFSRVHVRMFI